MANKNKRTEPWTNSRILVTAGAVALFSLLLLGPLAVLFPWSDWFSGKDAPAWVQAVGSVAAILVAVLVPAWQHEEAARKAEQSEYEERCRKASIAIAVCIRALRTATRIASRRCNAEHIEGKSERRAQYVSMRDVRNMLKDLAPHDAPSAATVILVSRCRTYITVSLPMIRHKETADICGSIGYGRTWLRLMCGLMKCVQQATEAENSYCYLSVSEAEQWRSSQELLAQFAEQLEEIAPLVEGALKTNATDWMR